MTGKLFSLLHYNKNSSNPHKTLMNNDITYSNTLAKLDKMKTHSLDETFYTLTSMNSNPPYQSLFSLTKWYSQEIVNVSEAIDQIENIYGLKNCCNKGCTHCCNYAIYIDAVELGMIKYRIESYSHPIKKLLKQRTSTICTFLEESNFDCEHSACSPDKLREKQKVYFSYKLSCPFLDENHSCMIYDIRPITCLTYRNYGENSDCINHDTTNLAIAVDGFELFLSLRLYENSSSIIRSAPLSLLPVALNKIL